jgi:hypothetical protein
LQHPWWDDVELSALSRPISLVAERAVRHLRDTAGPVTSLELCQEVLATSGADEEAARRILEAAFGGDPRLTYRDGAWALVEPGPRPKTAAPRDPSPEPDRALILVQGEPPAAGRPYKLTAVSALRLRGDEVLAACGGDAVGGASGSRLRRAILETLNGALPVIHDPPGALKALEDWLEEPLDFPVSLRKLAQSRLGLPARHDLETLVARLQLVWRDADDPLEQADTLDLCLQGLRRQGETLEELRASLCGPGNGIDWSRFAFDRDYLAEIPRMPGTYQFYDDEGRLLYVGKSKDLHRRIGSYFREDAKRPARVQRLVDAVHRIEYEPTLSDLEATIREAQLIREEEPQHNVQRGVTPGDRRTARLKSILILEPAIAPCVLRAYLIRGGRLLDRVGIGPRGGGLTRIQRVLDDHFFSGPSGPTTVAGPDLDVELIVRWLAAHRDRAVAFDPTDLSNSQEVIDRLRWFLSHGSPFDPDGFPVFSR